ncbi:MAG: hypothetical protein MNSN_01710 [Minisyncoccus archaeiphilus]|uniref:hypothetical protein n=1 Tax=Minisyncoccus archaeiphilus TaxID=3238481 RepID=UPI002B16F2B2|nr:MAG: hypothetical protein MNSN_01710 [Candidatus Parcubacteria bacterium]
MERQIKLEYVLFAIIAKDGIDDGFTMIMVFETEDIARKIFKFEKMSGKKKIVKIRLIVEEDCKDS